MKHLNWLDWLAFSLSAVALVVSLCFVNRPPIVVKGWDWIRIIPVAINIYDKNGYWLGQKTTKGELLYWGNNEYILTVSQEVELEEFKGEK